MLKDLLKKKMTKSVSFMGDEVEIKKLSVAEVLDLQSTVSTIQSKKKVTETDSMSIVIKTLRLGLLSDEGLTDEEFMEYPLDELSTLSDAIVIFSGMGSNAPAVDLEGNV